MSQTTFLEPVLAERQLPDEIFNERTRYEVFNTDPRICAGAMQFFPSDFQPRVILDAGCGDEGRWGRAAKAVFPHTTLIGVDIRPLPQVEGFDQWCASQDLLTWECPVKPDLIVSNPPFSLAEPFLTRCYDWLEHGGMVLFLLRAAFAHGARRYRRLYSQHLKPWLEVRLVQRPVFVGEHADIKTEYSLFLWRKGVTERLPPEWLNWR